MVVTPFKIIFGNIRFFTLAQPAGLADDYVIDPIVYSYSHEHRPETRTVTAVTHTTLLAESPQRPLEMYKPQAVPIDSLAHSPVIHEAAFLDIHVHAMHVEAFRAIVASIIHADEKSLIAHHNLHSLYLWHKEDEASSGSLIHDYYKRARYILIDGMSMVVLGRLYGHPIDRDSRIVYNQELPHMMALAAESGWRVFYLGSSDFVARLSGDLLRKQHPGLQLQTHHGFFTKDKDSSENHAILDSIAAFRPHILFVGMGMPIQEQWIEENFNSIRANVILSSGATLDYFAGTLPRPPAWIGQVGLEWAYRLMHDPRRLAFRYLAEPWLILKSVTRRRYHRAASYRHWRRIYHSRMQ